MVPSYSISKLMYLKIFHCIEKKDEVERAPVYLSQVKIKHFSTYPSWSKLWPLVSKKSSTTLIVILPNLEWNMVDASLLLWKKRTSASSHVREFHSISYKADRKLARKRNVENIASSKFIQLYFVSCGPTENRMQSKFRVILHRKI